MSAPEAEPTNPVSAPSQPPVQGMRKNGTPLLRCNIVPAAHTSPGKHWHQPKKAFRPTAGLTSYAKRAEERKALAAVKAKEKELKDEKEAARQVRHLARIGKFSLTP
ncbi:Cgr1 family-domain-containing protein [Phyllosticta capitalensis]|uniref:Cgr1 family-domain-containing protein n=1 Tax=Phyllosticta capitalensis TaxID=121624 RepID=UPI003132904D